MVCRESVGRHAKTIGVWLVESLLLYLPPQRHVLNPMEHVRDYRCQCKLCALVQ